ncbi:MAG: dTDP-4-dehydrorhamnose reductase [Xanthomonadaceae bacterium]|nr:dTDP-4-dehydrorhamnose reductase [Xanthomonadaceae bacterium]
MYPAVSRPILATGLAGLGEVIQTDRDSGDFRCDLSDHRLVDKSLHRVRPDVVVHPAAWTAVDRAEDEPETAMRVNRDLPGWLAGWCREHDALLIHFSTDYVFSGPHDRPWREDDDPAPGNVYGRSKLESERLIQASGARAVVLRTAWLYSHFPGNFLSAILTRAERGHSLKVVSDQIGSPTWAGHLAEACCRVIVEQQRLPALYNLFHVAGRGQLSWYEFARMAVERAVEFGVLDQPVQVEPIESAHWPQKARRPVWSVLDCERFEALFDTRLPSVEQGLVECLEKWKNALC